jgi:hypothetical protein
MSACTSLRQASKSFEVATSAWVSWRHADGGRTLESEQLHLSAYVVRQMFSEAVSRYFSSTMKAQTAHHRIELEDPAQRATAPTPLARFVPTAAAVSDQTVDQWVEQELQRGRRGVRAGLTMLALFAVAAVPVVLLVR